MTRPNRDDGGPRRAYTTDDLQIIDPIAGVRQFGLRLFDLGYFNRTEAVGHIIQGALLCGIEEIGVRIIGAWAIIFANGDWLTESGEDISVNAFARVQSFKAGGVNSMRPEILLTAFSEDVFTARQANLTVIKGSVGHLLNDYANLLDLGERVVGFRTAESGLIKSDA